MAAAALLALAHSLAAQQTPTPTPSPSYFGQPQTSERVAPFWKAELPGGSYLVALASIRAVCEQSYLLDGAARVTEVNVVTDGPFQPRFYFIQMLPMKVPQSLPGAEAAQAVVDRAQSTLQKAADQALPNEPVWAKVIKTYPTTTHAGTLEFRLEKKEQLEKLRESAERAWVTGKGEVFTPQGTRPYKPSTELKQADSKENSEKSDSTDNSSDSTETP
jgi:hypothetical protein